MTELTKQTLPGQARHRQLALILLAAVAVRLVLALASKGYSYDMSCFVAWGEKLAAEGPAAFYAEGYFADYPPGYILVLGLVARLRQLFHLAYESPWTYFLLALVPTLCDAATTALVWQVGNRCLKNEGTVLRLTLFTAFCPVLLFDTAVWKQIDGAFSLPILLCFLLLEGKQYLPACLLYGLALAIKPQALLAGPVLALSFLVAVAAEKTASGRVKAVGRIFAGAALALLPVLLIGLPFFGIKNLLPALVDKYVGTAGSYPYATINAFNWMAALGGNWAAQESAVLGPLTWQMLGIFNLVALTAALCWLGVRAYQKQRFSPLLLAAFYILGVYTLAHCMHERYMVFGTLLVVLAAARWNDRRLLGAAAGFSVTGLVNLAAVYSLVGGDDEWLTSATSAGFARIIGFAETACFGLLAWAVYDLAVHGRALPLTDPNAPAEMAEPKHPQQKKSGQEKAAKQHPASEEKRRIYAGNALPSQPPVIAGQPRWSNREKLALGVLTAATALLSFAYLGDFTAPQTVLDAAGTAQTEQFTLAGDTVPVSLWVYPGAPDGFENGSLTITDDATGQPVATMELTGGNTFTWSRTDFAGATPGASYTATVSAGRVVELSLRDASGNPVAVEGGGALLDEQGKVPATFSQLNSMYFDEIYHARTGYELRHGLTVFETTHPPLGKDFIMLGIALFGMTGFGWRFAGTLFGVLLVPLLWCFVRRLTRKPWVAAATACLLALDFMRFSQSRIATIDTSSTFFILLGGYCMVWYAQTALQKGIPAAVLPMALGGVAFGLGAATKWTGIYAGAGLAALYFGVLYARWQRNKTGFRRELIAAFWGGVVFYIAVPVMIYAASYLPYLWKDPAFGLQDLWNSQTYMYWYHSQLTATHPFESSWYTWPLVLRPVWYYSNGNLPAGQYGSIAGMGSPVVWLAGLAAVLALGWRQLAGKGDKPGAGAGVLVLYAAQLLPWMLVTRATFMYHYFPGSMFALAALGLVLAGAKEERKAKKVAAILCGAALVAFLWFYPALSGLPVPGWWAKSLLVLPSWGFYIL